MLRLSALFALLLLVLAPVSAAQAAAQEKQEKEDPISLNRKAIEALQAKKYDEGVALLMRILEIQPKDNGTAYNLACAWSLKGDVEKGFEWLGKAVDWGWGKGTGTLVGSSKQVSHAEMTKTDPDLELLRKDPRFEKVIERMGKAAAEGDAARKKGEEYAATPAVYIPEKVAGMKEMPLLVVLHDSGSTKDEVVKGRWKAVADELGFALVAPSGTVLVGDEAAKGMTWFEDQGAYRKSYWTFEKPVNDAVSAFKKDHPLEKSKVVIAGEGKGGLVALNVAIGSPGLYKGAVALNGALDPEVMAQKAPTAGKMGLKMELLVDETVVKKAQKDAGKDEAEFGKTVASWTQTLQTWGIEGEVKTFAPDAKDPAQVQKMLVEAVRAVLVPAVPKDAAAPK